MDAWLASIKKSSIHFQILSLFRVPTQGSWKVWLKAVSAMFTDVVLRSAKGTQPLQTDRHDHTEGLKKYTVVQMAEL